MNNRAGTGTATGGTIGANYLTCNGNYITVPFTEYISNVASSEIYPTWPKNALIANIIKNNEQYTHIEQYIESNNSLKKLISQKLLEVFQNQRL